MTKLEELKLLLETTGLPVAYRAFPEGKAPPLPFLCYQETETITLRADSEVYATIRMTRIELYTKEKDPITEGKVQDVLSSFAWEKDEEYIDSEQCYQIIYEIEV